MQVLFFVLLGTFFSSGTISMARANIGKIYHFSEDIRNIIWKTSPPNSNFIYNIEESEQIQAYAQLDGEISRYAFSGMSEAVPCPDSDQGRLAERINNRRNNLYFMMSSSSQIGQSRAQGFFGQNNYHHFMTNRGNSANATLSSLRTII